MGDWRRTLRSTVTKEYSTFVEKNDFQKVRLQNSLSKKQQGSLVCYLYQKGGEGVAFTYRIAGLCIK